MENMDVFWDGVEQTIKSILDKKYWDRQEGGEYFSTIYTDYRDEIDNYTLKEIMDHECPKDALNECFMDMEIEQAWEYEYPEIKKEIEGAIPEELYEYFADDISEWLEAHVHLEADVQHYNRDICLTLLVDTGDANYDYTCNNILNYASDGTGDYPEESSILWLAEQQGKGELLKKATKEYCLSGKRPEDAFVNSVISELVNLPSSMGALTFLVKMPLMEYMELIDDVRSKKNGMLIIPKDAECGLYNKWDGGGSVLEIELDKDVEVPLSMIGDLVPDIDKCNGIRGYLPWSVHNVYGVNDSLWRAKLAVCTVEKEVEMEEER